MEKAVNKHDNYYNRQLESIKLNSEYLPKIKILEGEGGNSTNYMNLSNECIDEVIYWLKALKKKNKDK
jgi:hypothetical protein